MQKQAGAMGTDGLRSIYPDKRAALYPP